MDGMTNEQYKDMKKTLLNLVIEYIEHESKEEAIEKIKALIDED